MAPDRKVINAWPTRVVAPEIFTFSEGDVCYYLREKVPSLHAHSDEQMLYIGERFLQQDFIDFIDPKELEMSFAIQQSRGSADETEEFVRPKTPGPKHLKTHTIVSKRVPPTPQPHDNEVHAVRNIWQSTYKAPKRKEEIVPRLPLNMPLVKRVECPLYKPGQTQVPPCVTLDDANMPKDILTGTALDYLVLRDIKATPEEKYQKTFLYSDPDEAMLADIMTTPFEELSNDHVVVADILEHPLLAERLPTPFDNDESKLGRELRKLWNAPRNSLSEALLHVLTALGLLEDIPPIFVNLLFDPNLKYKKRWTIVPFAAFNGLDGRLFLNLLTYSGVFDGNMQRRNEIIDIWNRTLNGQVSDNASTYLVHMHSYVFIKSGAIDHERNAKYRLRCMRYYSDVPEEDKHMFVKPKEDVYWSKI